MIFFLWNNATTAIAGTPHIIYGKVLSPDGTPPVKDHLESYAYVLERPDELLSKSSVGCGYDVFSDGWLWFEAGNYITPWVIYEKVRIIVNDTLLQNAGVADLMLNSSGSQHISDLHLQSGDHIGPIASNTLVDGLAHASIPEGTGNVIVTATLDDSICGNSNIQSAEYFIDSDSGLGSGTVMASSDGSFDTPQEGVRASVNTSTWTEGSNHIIYVRGRDSAGNWGTAHHAFVEVTIPPCDASSLILSNFNGTSIAAGKYIWFNSIVKVNGRDLNPAVIRFSNSKIKFTANSVNYELTVPGSTINFSSTATTAMTTFTGGEWVTTIPLSYSGNVFLSGLAFQVPAGGLPGGINPVTWFGNFMSDTSGIDVQWKWAAAVYTQFSIDYNLLGVKPLDGDKLNEYQNSDHTGTPEHFKSYVTGGARGGGGSNYTGSYSGTESKIPCPF